VDALTCEKMPEEIIQRNHHLVQERIELSDNFFGGGETV